MENQKPAPVRSVPKDNENVVQVIPREESVIRKKIPLEHSNEENIAPRKSTGKERGIHTNEEVTSPDTRKKNGSRNRKRKNVI